MKKLIICFILLLFISCDSPDLSDQSGKVYFFDKPIAGMNIIVKVGSAMPDRSNPLWASSWSDGQILEIQPDDKYIGTATRKHFCIIHLQEDMKRHKDIKKYWHNPFAEKIKRKRDYYIDFIALEKQGLISLSQLENIYNKQTETILEFDMTFKEFEKYINHEDGKQRLTNSLDKGGTIDAAGTYSIGTGMTYADLGAFEADLPANLTSPSVGGTVIGEFQVSEATDSDGTQILFNQTTNATDDIKISVNSANRHSGVWTTDKARMVPGRIASFTGYFIVEYLQLSSDLGMCIEFNYGVAVTIRSCVIKGDASKIIHRDRNTGTLNYYNNVLYGGGYGIQVKRGWDNNYNPTINIFHNTVTKGSIGLYLYDGGGSGSNIINVKNNILQSNGVDFSDEKNLLTSSACNITKDGTSPDVAYRNINLHDAVSNFVDYDNNNYNLEANGSEITTLDDATDPGTMPAVDIRGVARSTWYIGAFELELPSGRRIIINKSY